MGFYFNTNSLTPSKGSSGGGGGGGASTIWAHNDLGSSYVVTAGDKVFISEISSSMEQEYKFTSAFDSTFAYWNSFSLSPYQGFDTLLIMPYNNNSATLKCGALYAFDVDTASLEYIQNTGVTGSAQFGLMRQIADKAVFLKRYSNYNTETYIENSNGISSASGRNFLFNNFEYAGLAANTDTSIYSHDEYGIKGALKGVIHPDGGGSYYYIPRWISSDGNSLIARRTSGTWYYCTLNDGVYTPGDQITLGSGANPNGVDNIGCTSDGKYIIQANYNNNTNRSYGGIITEVDITNKTMNLYTDLNISDSESIMFYPSTQILIAYSSSSIRMWKYDPTNGFVQQTLDFGSVSFSKLKSSYAFGVTLNYDASMMCVNDYTDGVYLFSLIAAAPNTYKAFPFKRINFNSSAFTGILTGQESGGNVEVKTVMS